MSLTISGTPHKARQPILPMSWLDWSRDQNEYVGGDYRVKLIEPYRWEVLHRGGHLLFDSSLHSALTQADHHYREQLRSRDLAMWGALLVTSVVAAAIMELTVGLTALWSVPLLGVILYTGLSSLVRLFAALTRNRFDPYRRPAPWESRYWWRR